MTLELAFQAVQTIAVVVGIVFGVFQLRQLRQQREIEAGIKLLEPLQADRTAGVLLLLHSLPDNLTRAQVRERLGDELPTVLATMSIFESLGPLVARGHVPLAMYGEFFRGPTSLVWRKMYRFVEEEREGGWPNLFEWLQWLAERMEELAPRNLDQPAFVRFAEWRDPDDYDRLADR